MRERDHIGDDEIISSDESDSDWARIQSRSLRIDGDRGAYRAAGKSPLPEWPIRWSGALLRWALAPIASACAFSDSVHPEIIELSPFRNQTINAESQSTRERRCSLASTRDAVENVALIWHLLGLTTIFMPGH